MATAAETKPSKPTAKGARKVRLTLALDGTPYTVKPMAREALPSGAVRGFTLSRIDRRKGKVSHVVAEGFEGLSCSCGDQTYRQTPNGGQCKHLAACRACGLF